MYFLLCVHCHSNTRLYEYRYVLVNFFYIILDMLLYQVLCTQEIHYPMYLYAYCVMFDIHCITHAILLIFLSLSTVNGNTYLFIIELHNLILNCSQIK